MLRPQGGKTRPCWDRKGRGQAPGVAIPGDISWLGHFHVARVVGSGGVTQGSCQGGESTKATYPSPPVPMCSWAA